MNPVVGRAATTCVGDSDLARMRELLHAERGFDARLKASEAALRELRGDIHEKLLASECRVSDLLAVIEAAWVDLTVLKNPSAAAERLRAAFASAPPTATEKGA